MLVKLSTFNTTILVCCLLKFKLIFKICKFLEVVKNVETECSWIEKFKITRNVKSTLRRMFDLLKLEI